MGEGHVLVARLNDGRVVAFAPRCPHQVTALDDATISDGRMRCPRHGYVYDTASGENILPTRDNRPEDLWKLKPGYLPCFEVSEHDGWVWLATEAKAPPESYDPALEEAPAQVEEVATPLLSVPLAAAEQALKFLSVVSGSTFDIRLPTTPRAGFAWRFELMGDLLSVVEAQFEPGDIPCQRIRLEARGVGAATLSCTYSSPGVTERPEVRTYIVRVAQK